MFPAKHLSADQFASLSLIGSGPLLEPTIAIGHLGVLLGHGYISASDNGYVATPTGMLRIASGS
jgi:hypothetical protein